MNVSRVAPSSSLGRFRIRAILFGAFRIWRYVCIYFFPSFLYITIDEIANCIIHYISRTRPIKLNKTSNSVKGGRIFITTLVSLFLLVSIPSLVSGPLL